MNPPSQTLHFFYCLNQHLKRWSPQTGSRKDVAEVHGVSDLSFLYSYTLSKAHVTVPPQLVNLCSPISSLHKVKSIIL